MKRERPWFAWVLRHGAWPNLAAAAVLVTSLTATLMTWRLSRREVQQRQWSRFNQTSDRIASALRERARDIEDELYSVRGLFSASVSVERGEFRAYVQSMTLHDHCPGIGGIGFVASAAPRGTNDELADHLEPVGDSKPAMQAITRDQDGIYGGAMGLSRDSGVMCNSGKVCIGPGQKDWGFVLFLPVYRNGQPQGTVEERRAAILGWVYTPVPAGAMLAAMPKEDSRLLDVHLYDGPALAAPSFLGAADHAAAPDLDGRSEFRSITMIPAGGRDLTVSCEAFGGFDPAAGHAEPVILLGGGMAISLLLFGVAWSLARTKTRAVALAEGMTAALRQSEEKFRETAQQLRTVLDALPVGVWFIDAEGKVVLGNPAALRIWGGIRHVGVEEYAQYKGWWADTGERVQSHEWGAARALLVGEAVLNEVIDIEAFDGKRKTIFNSAVPVRDEAGRIFGVVSINEDITQRRRTEQAVERLRRRNEAILDSAGEGIFGLDAEGKTTFLNPAASRMLGAAPGEFIDRPQHSIIHHSRPDGTPYPVDECPISAVCRGKSLYNEGREFFWKKDGSGFPVEYVCTPIHENGKTIGAVMVFRDITERERAEKALHAARARLQSVVQTAVDAIILADGAGKIVFWNDAAAEIFGYEEEDVVGKPLTFLMPEPYRAAHVSGLARVSGGGASSIVGKTVELVALRRDGREFPVDLSLTSWSDGTARFFTGIIRDISERKQAERMERERSGLKDAVAAMERVLGVVAHELRTPLAGLRAISEYLLEDGARQTVEWEQFIGNMHEEVVRMTDTVNNLLEAARLNSGQAQWNWSEVRLHEVCNEALETFEPLVDSQRVALTLSVTPGEAVMKGDADAIRRLLVNLIGNARKHTSQGSIHVQASTYRADGVEWAEIQVRDTGQGISAAIAARLGDAFALNSGVVGANHVAGTGLGLAICKGIVAAHGGALSVQSAEGQGTTITVRLRGDLEKPSEAASPLSFVAKPAGECI
jgi:PAS domain S-box-containing protein